MHVTNGEVSVAVSIDLMLRRAVNNLIEYETCIPQANCASVCTHSRAKMRVQFQHSKRLITRSFAGSCCSSSGAMHHMRLICNLNVPHLSAQRLCRERQSNDTNQKENHFNDNQHMQFFAQTLKFLEEKNAPQEDHQWAGIANTVRRCCSE